MYKNIDSTNKSAQAAVYSNSGGSVGSLLGSSLSVTLSSAGQYTFDLTSGVSVTSGTSYWLCSDSDTTSASTNNLVYNSGSASQEEDTTTGFSYGTWPSTMPSATFTGANQFEIYATINLSATDEFSGSLFSLTQSGQALFQNSTNSTTAFQVQNSSGSGLLTVDSSGSHVIVGSSSTCEGVTGTGKFCVAQGISSSGGTSVNANNVSNVTTTGAETVVGQKVMIDDTSSSVANTLQGFLVDNTGTTNTSATVTGVVVNNPSTNAGNLLQLESSGSNVFTVSNTGATALTYAGAGSALQINSTSTGSLITLTPGTGAQTDTANINFNGRTVVGYDGTNAAAYLQGESGKALELMVNGNSSASLYINTSGNVGIGTTSPHVNLEVSGGVYLGTETLTANDQADVCLFGDSSCGVAQSGAFNNQLNIFGGSSQTRHLLLYQAASGNAFIGSSYADLVIETTSNNANIWLEPNCTGKVISSTITAIDPSTGNSAETWHTMSLQNGFSAGTDINGTTYAPAYKLLPDGAVALRGVLVTPSSGGVGATTIYTMPTGYRPGTYTSGATVANGTGSTQCFLYIRPNGNLQLSSSACSGKNSYNFWLDGAIIQIDN